MCQAYKIAGENSKKATSYLKGHHDKRIHGMALKLGGGGGRGVSESMDRWECAILALKVVPKNLIFALKSYPIIYFTKFYACYFSKENYASLLILKMASSLSQVAKIN